MKRIILIGYMGAGKTTVGRALAKELGLACIAEGVETQSQVELLQESSCVLAQGYFFDRPLPTADFEKRLGDRCYQLV